MKKAETDIKQHINKLHLTKTDVCCMLMLAAGTLVFILLLTGNGRLYGSEVDWISQHSVLPEYFRQQYYETGKLLPQFAAHLGAGQNMFHFSYYGLLSPVILPSYLLPGVPMTSYIAVTSVILLLAGGILFYCWLKKHLFSTPTVFAVSFLFQFSSALLYHSHKQIMFVNYIPFLLLALIGTDYFFEHRKSGLMMTGIFLMAMTSYFYSIGGLLALTVYGIYIYFGRNSGAGVKSFFITGFSFALRLIIPVGMAALLLLPSLSAIFNGRSSQSSKLVFSSLLVPKLNLLNLLYSPYGIGLTAIGLLAAFRLLTRNKPGERILFTLLAVLFSVPFFLFLLNGGLYMRGKVFIPFLPLMLLITALYLEEILSLCREGRVLSLKQSAETGDRAAGNVFQLKNELRKAIVVCGLMLVLDRSIVWLGFTLECAIVLAGFYYGIRKRSFFLCCFPSCLVCFGICLGVNLSDPLVSKTDSDSMYSQDKQDLLKEITQKDHSTWRFNDFTQVDFTCNIVPVNGAYRTSLYSSTYDSDYNKFHLDGIGNANDSLNAISCWDTNNIMFQTFMGVKYLISEDTAPAGYRLAAQSGPYGLYENENVFPLAWGSGSLMSKREFESLSEQDQSVALLNYIIVEEAPASGYRSPLQKETLDLPFAMTQNGDRCNIDLKEDVSMTLGLAQPLNERLLMLSFSFDKEPLKDVVIGANKITNRLTGHKEMYPNNHYNFQYVLSENTPSSSLNLNFSAGTYDFSLPECYSLDYNEVRRAAQSVTPLDDSGYHTDETVLRGTITMEEDGYFTASIPYDKGFTALVDGRPQPIELVNTAFIGFPLSSGRHEIKLVYQTPLLKEGATISSLFLLLFLAVLFLEQTQQLSSYTSAQGRKKRPVPHPAPVLTINASYED